MDFLPRPIPFTNGGTADEPLLLAGGGGGVVELLDCERFGYALVVFCRSNRSYRFEKNALQTKIEISSRDVYPKFDLR